MNKVLVIGASGYAGRYVVNAMIGRGMEVYALEHRSPLPDDKNIKVIKGGISAINSKLIDAIKPDTIFHLARPTMPRWRKAGRFLAARYAATLNRQLLKELERSRENPELVFASGSLMYGSSPLPHDEDAPIRPISYARQYHRGEIPFLESLQKGKANVRIIRLPWLLGEGSWFEWFYLRPMAGQRAIPLFGAGDNKMEIIDVADAARLMIRIANSGLAPGVYNIVSSGAITQVGFATKLATITGLPLKEYREIFPGGLEKEALEAFTSNIVITTKYPYLTDNFQFTPLLDTLKRITVA